MPDHPIAVKDEGTAHPISASWRPLLRRVVSAFVRGDFALETGLPGVAPVPAGVAEHIRTYVADYGEVLVELPEETWTSSRAQWMDPHWHVIVDLWTEAEGRSDLVLTGNMLETQGDLRFTLGLVYVP